MKVCTVNTSFYKVNALQSPYRKLVQKHRPVPHPTLTPNSKLLHTTNQLA